MDFGSVTVGTTSPAMTRTITNTGDQTLTFTSLVVTDPTYSQTNNCTSLAPNASCTVTIKFSPAKTGSDNQFININDNASTSPQEFNLYGTGTSGQVSRRWMRRGRARMMMMEISGQLKNRRLPRRTRLRKPTELSLSATSCLRG